MVVGSRRLRAEWNMKIEGGKFVIAGGVSLIGSHLAEQLLKSNASEIVLFDNYSLSSPDTVEQIATDPRIKLVRGDILRLNELYDVLDGASGVFAVAGFLTLPLSQNPPLGLSVNIQGIVNIYEACRYRGVRKVVFSSSVAAYGDTQAELVDEDSPFNWSKQQPAVALYSGSKILGEAIGKLYRDRHGIQSISLRYSSVYGERQHQRALNTVYILDTFERVRRNEAPIIPDDGLEVHDYIHAEDVARANVMAMASECAGGSFNAVTGVSTTLNRLVEIIIRAAGSNIKPEYRTDPKKVRGSSSTGFRFSNARIKAEIGWKPEIAIEDGIARVIQWKRNLAAIA
jgi:UDP-glucose 4-epimerase